MTSLNEIILQLKEKQFAEFCESLKATQAEKYFILANHIRNNEDEDAILQDLAVNKSAFYTLRSRLHQKIKSYLSEGISTVKTGLYHHVTQMPNLLYNTSKKAAIAVLEKLEADLIKSDMPYELSHLYSAMKKIHIHSPKYFHYSQLYNKTLAYTTSIQKAEELLIDFSKSLSAYYVSRDPQTIEILAFIRKEIHNLSSLYSSHRLRLFRLFTDISFSLFFPDSEIIQDDDPVEDMLKEAEKILKSCPNDLNYLHLDKVYDFLSFEYYNGLGVHKKASTYYASLQENLPSFMLYNFCTFPGKLLISKLEHYAALKKTDLLWNEDRALHKNYSPDPDDLPGYITHNKYKALVCILSNEYVEAINYLSSTCELINFKNHPHTEIELKLLLTLCYSMVRNYELSQQTLKSVVRRLNETEDNAYANAKAMAKLLHIQNSPHSNSASIQRNVFKLRNKFIERNEGAYKMFEGLEFDDNFINKLCNLTSYRILQLSKQTDGRLNQCNSSPYLAAPTG